MLGERIPHLMALGAEQSQAEKIDKFMEKRLSGSSYLFKLLVDAVNFIESLKSPPYPGKVDV